MKRNSPIDVWKNIDVRGDDECWPWRGVLNTGGGYGYIGIAGGKYMAHRVVYALTNPGSIEWKAPENKQSKEFVLHSCDNRKCCNPRHMSLGNYRDNNQDASRKGRKSRNHGVKGVKNYAHKLTDQQVNEIRWIASKGISNGEIESLYPVCNEAVRRVVNRVSYKEI